MRRSYVKPIAEVHQVDVFHMMAFSDGDQLSPGSGGGEMGGTPDWGFNDGDMENPDIGGSSGGFWDGDM